MMKYLLPFLEGLPDGPNLSDPDFQRLLHDVQAGKVSAKGAADAWYESLEKIVNELKSSPESLPFQKPVSKREAPDYYVVIKNPMDLQTIMKNIKAHKYRSKADFAADLELIWDNCAYYNTLETHPIRVQARYLKQKADHHLEFLADRNERSASTLLALAIPSEPSRGAYAPTQPSPLRQSSQLPGGDEDAAGESDDGGGADGVKEGSSFRGEAGAGPQSNTAAANAEEGTGEGAKEAARARSGSRGARESSVSSALAGRGFGKANGVSRSTTPFRPKLPTSLENASAIVRTPYTMTHHLSLALTHAGPSSLTQGRAKELLQATPPPSWYPGSVTSEDEELHYEGSWWGVMCKEESYAAGLPAVPTMLEPTSPRRARVPRSKRVPSMSNGHVNGHAAPTPPLDPPKALDLESAIYRNVDKLQEARKYQRLINDWQRIEHDGGILPNPSVVEAEEKYKAQEEKAQRKRARREENEAVKKRRKTGGELGEEEAVRRMKKASAVMLAHEGFESANEVTLDMFTRVAVDHIYNLGRTFRLLLDGFGNKMLPDEIILHALHENGQIQTHDLEEHIKDDIEREGSKIAEMARKMRQGYKEVTTAPVIEDDMLFNENEGMLMDGNFAEELGEDFLGLREMGIDKEFGLSSLSVPSALFHGRRRRVAGIGRGGAAGDIPDYPPPPPFVPLNPSTIATHLPALLHAFYAARIESGKSISEDDPFDPAHSQIGSLGQIVIKSQSAAAAQAAKRKREAEAAAAGDKAAEKKTKPKKPIQQGVGKGNWARPSKEEREKKAEEKKNTNGVQAKGGDGTKPDGGEIVAYGDDDAEGEEE